jgi:DNA polymerase I
MRMSPINRIDGVKKTGNGFTFSKAESGFSPIQQPLGGRITLNLDLAFERQWNDSQRGTLPSMSLEFVSQTLFGEGKSKETIFEDPNEFYRRGWLEDTEAYLKYALIDVELLVRIDETNFCSEAIIALQRLLVAPFEACFYASHMGSIYFMRNADWICKTGSKVDKRETYDGAMIYDPLSEGTNGLHLNVAAFDFAGLYPSMMIARNISFETKSEEPTEFAVNIATPRDFSPVTRKHMLYYKTDKLGLLPRAVLELKELRNEYKRLMRDAREAGNDSEVVKWNNNQMAVKRLMASFYGIVAFQGFGWADVNLAASITASAREAIRLAAFKAKEMKV